MLIPTYVVDRGRALLCWRNMPGAVAKTSTVGLNNATLTAGALADKGYRAALAKSSSVERS